MADEASRLRQSHFASGFDAAKALLTMGECTREECDTAKAERDEARRELDSLNELVQRQAEDVDLWLRADDAPYVHKELRALHDAIEQAHGRTK